MNCGISEAAAPVRRLWRALCAALLAALALVFAHPAQAQSSGPVVVTQQASAVVVTPASLVAAQPLQFGQILPTTTGGTVSVDAVNGDCTAVSVSVIGNCQYAQFVGMGTKNMNVRLTLVTNSDLTGPGQTMVLDQIILGFNSPCPSPAMARAKARARG